MADKSGRAVESEIGLIAAKAHLRVLSGHKQDSFNALAWSEDGKTLASGSSDSTIRIWDGISGKLLRTLEGHCDSVESVSWSADGKTLASGSSDKTIRIWDALSGKLLHTLKGHTYLVESVSWSADGKTLASGSSDSTVRIWDALSGKLLHSLAGHTSAVRSVSWSADGKTLASGSADSTVRIWDALSGKLLRSLAGLKYWVQSVSWSADGKTLASGSSDGTVRIWDAPTGNLLRSLAGHRYAVHSVSWSADGKTLASGSSDKTIRIWNGISGKLLRTLEGHCDSVESVSWSADGKTLASGSSDKTIKIWDALSGKLLHTLKGHTNLVESVSWSADGKTFASGSSDSTVRIWDALSGKLLRSLVGHKYWIQSVSWSADGKILASGSSDSTVRIWDALSGKLLNSLEGHTSAVRSVNWSADEKILASGSADKTIRIWDALSGKLLRTLEGHTDWVRSVNWSADGKTLASGSSDNTVRIWDAFSGKLLNSLEGHSSAVRSVSWSADGKTLASGSIDETIRIWDPFSGTLLRTLEGHTALIESVCWSADGKILASLSEDNFVRVWNAQSGDCLVLHKVAKPTHSPLEVAFLPTSALSANYGTTVLGDPDLIVDIVGEPSPSAPSTKTAQVISAKIVLVGESNVGKSYLAHRIVNGQAPDAGSIQSTHGMKFWPLAPEQLSKDETTPDGPRREAVLWDMGGQQEYRLVHQLFLHDTTVVLLLLDPTRGASAFKEIETWNKYLAKQLGNRPAVKLLVGAKLDHALDVVDRQAVERLCSECGFSGYYETSALTGRGLEDLTKAMASAIAWEDLGKTSRPELFQRIRDQIELQRRRGEVVLHLHDLHRALGDRPPGEDEKSAVRAVTEQLAAQGVIACSQVGKGEPVLVLQIQEIERYAGSLILAARGNPRGVPALELIALGRADFTLPGIEKRERLPRLQELAVLDCTVQLLLQHGICFEHEGLLIFPSLFASASAVGSEGAQLPHAISLYYDFAGAIDNIYASLICWLVLARDFGQVRLWPDRAEFALEDGGVCGLRKVSKADGFAHVDVYFDEETPGTRKSEFICFVEDHLVRQGVEIRESLVADCPKGHIFDQETLKMRISEGDVLCPRCEIRHGLTDGAAGTRQREPRIRNHTWTLKTSIEDRSKAVNDRVMHKMLATGDADPLARPIRLLHLSDLHFDSQTPVPARLQWLLDDLKQPEALGGLDFQELDYLVVSGDFTDKGSPEGFAKAYEFLSLLTKSFGLSAERCILAPGNHDVEDAMDAYMRRKDAQGLSEREWIKQGSIILARDPEKYPQRFKAFSDGLFHKFLQRPYPAACAEQGMSIPFFDTGLQFLVFNSCWEIDEFHRHRAGIHPEAVANAVKQSQLQVKDAQASQQWAQDKPVLRIAVWHHAVTAPDFKMTDLDFMGHLRKNGVRLALHGDVHEMRRQATDIQGSRNMFVLGAGSFGARASDRAESMPRLYHVIEIGRNHDFLRVHTRQQKKADGDWDGWYEWADPKGGKARLPHFEIRL